VPADDRRYDAALAAAIRIIDRLQTTPHATMPELLSIVTYAVLQAIDDAARHPCRSLTPSAN
jgi:hypothetical protein